MIGDKQSKIFWHFNNLKTSHVDKDVMTSIIKPFITIYAWTMLLSIIRGKIHEYLGMTVDSTTKVEIKVTIYDYIDEMIDNANDFWKNGTRMATPAPKNLYETQQTDDPEAELLPDNEKSGYHTMPAHGLYL